MVTCRKLFASLLAFTWLAVTACGADTLYKIEPGPFEFMVKEDAAIEDTVQQRNVTFRVMYPDGPGQFPVVVLSHGGFCPPQMYDRITGHWVSHGYIVVEPNHVDSPNNAERPGPQEMEMIVHSRVRDASLALDALDDIALKAGIANQVADHGRAISGHSFGAGVAMMKTGQNLKPGQAEHWGPADDARFEAAVYLSAPGGGEEMVDDAFDGLRAPFMATGGTQDVGRVDPGDLSPGDWRRQVFLRAPPGDKYSVIIEDADHYLGGLICRADRGGDPDPGAVEIIRTMTTAFLDAYLKNDPVAKRFLMETDVSALTNGRVDYRYR